MFNQLRKIVQAVEVAPDIQTVLGLIVKGIRQAMKTEVCSVYLFDPVDERYVLMATKGLNAEAVGHVSLSASEGIVSLVGRSAQPINLEDASTHPDYIYVASTGEERFNAFLGVPIIHQRHVLGVLVVQQQESRQFSQFEETFLITISSQLAGAIAHAEAKGLYSAHKKKTTDRRFDGIAGAAGVAIGKVVVVSPPADLNAVVDRSIENVELEIERFEEALNSVRHDIKVVGRSLAKRLRSDEQALFDVYLRMLDDNALAGEVVVKIREGVWAQAALRDVIADHVGQFSRMEDPYLRERATDIRDLGRRVLAYLQESGSQQIELLENTILVAEELTPAMLGEVSTDKLVGLISVHGSGNSHAAILARSMGIPTVLGVVDLPFTRLNEQEVILDGYSGRIYVNPSEKLCLAYQEIIKGEQEFAEELASLKELPAETTDGCSIPLWVNTGLVADVARSLERGAQGIGLYRTEIPFMIRESFPSEQEQFDTYRKQLEAFYPRPVTMRTLDIGGDKSLPYFLIDEENPFLGWRGIRVTLDHPDIFVPQIRAMLRANIGLGNLRIMLPMITSVHEVAAANLQIDLAIDGLRDEGIPVERPRVGIMIEVPAAIYQIRRFAEMVDFISVGSNDLTQYLLAVDRNNPRVAGLHRSYHPAVLQALVYIAKEAKAVSLPVSICGEIAADPMGAILLMSMGYDVLSMNATNLPRVKAAIRGVSKKAADGLLKQVMAMDDADEIQRLLHQRIRSFGLVHLDTPEIPD